MAIAVDTTSTLDTSGGANPSWSHTCTGTNLLLVVLLPRWPANAVSAVSYNGVALTQAVTSGDDGNSDETDIWYLVGPAIGAHTVAVTCTATTGRIGATSYTGVDQSAPVGTGVSAIGSSITPTVNASSATGEVVVGSMSADGSAAGTPTAGAGQTPPDWAVVANFQATAASHEAGSTTTTHSYTITTTTWAIAALPIKPYIVTPVIPESSTTVFPHPPMRTA